MNRINNNSALNYKFSQIFSRKRSNKKILQDDIISALKFDPTGNYIAVGDKAGRIIIFHNDKTKKVKKGYDYLTEFQSHINQFEYLRSI